MDAAASRVRSPNPENRSSVPYSPSRWGSFKDWANIAEKGNWRGFGLYTATLWGSSLLLIPCMFLLAVQVGRALAHRRSSAADDSPAPVFKDVFLAFAYPLVPLGLLAWVTFSLPLILVNGSYILMVLSDPFGWGWNLFGTANIPWTPLVPQWGPYLQVPLLLIGLYFALKTGKAHAHRLFGDRLSALKAFAPTATLLTGFVVFFLWLYVG